MATLKEEAINYEHKTTKNIADLEVVPTDIEIINKSGIDQKGEPYEYKVVVIDNEEYRIPNSVFGALKDILLKKPSLKTFSVTKSGKEMSTRYTVIPLD